MDSPDVLIVTGLPMEYRAAYRVGLASAPGSAGVITWEERDEGTPTPYVIGDYLLPGGTSMRVALAYADRMSGGHAGFLAASLVQRLSPRCLAMCGACAGNPDEVSMGDVIAAELTYQYDEGKREKDKFVPDHRQSPLRDPGWLRLLRALDPANLPSYGPPTPEDADLWLLEQVYINRDPKKHPARTRYIPDKIWEQSVKALVQKGYVIREGSTLKLSVTGRDYVEESLLYGTTPEKLPFAVKVGPMASGNAVVKDGVTWDMLATAGVRTIVGLEMEAATIGQTAKLSKLDWVVMKGVMDYADPNKDDRYKPFAARASAEVLFSFLASRYAQPRAEAGLVPGLSSDTATRQDAAYAKAVSDGVATEAYVALVEAIFDADYFLPGGGLKTIPRFHMVEFIPDELLQQLEAHTKYNSSLKDVAQALMRHHWIDQALSFLVQKVHDDWNSKLLPYAKLSIHNIAKRYPAIGLSGLPPLSDEEKQIVGIKWYVADALYQEERLSWQARMAESGLDLQKKTVDWKDLELYREEYCETFASLIKTRIEIDIALVQTSTSVRVRQLYDYLHMRAERSSLQILNALQEICEGFPNRALAQRRLSIPMSEAIASLVQAPLTVTPSLKWIEAMKQHVGTSSGKIGVSSEK